MAIVARGRSAAGRAPRRRLAWLAVAALAAIVAVSAHAPAARASGPSYTPQQPPQQALYRDGWTGRYLLDGQWLFRPDATDVGLGQGWWQNAASTAGWSPVAVPNAYNAADFSMASMTGYVGWYRKDFILPPGPRGRRWIIRFESVNYRAQLWLNGKQLGSHTGAYLPFEFDLKHLRAGVNQLIVRVDDRRSPTDIPSGPSGGWWNYGGILREVYLRPVLRADPAQVIVRPLLRCPTCAATIEVRVAVRNVTGVRQAVRVRGSFGRVPIDLGAAAIAPFSTWTTAASITIAHPRLWSLSRPTLYRATVNLYGTDGTRLGGYVTYSGIRSITMSASGQLELNGRILHLRGAHIQESDVVLGSALDPAHLSRLITWIRSLGAHLIRSHYPLNPQLQEMADHYGILIWSEIPVNHELSPFLGQPSVLAQAERMLRQNILTNENHPSVLLWSIGNELAAPTTAPEAAYIASAAALAHSLDPTRPVGMAISDWPGLPCQTAYAPLDTLGFNDYFGWFSAGGGGTDDRDALSTFLDSFRACYPQKALFVTEFGFDGNRNGPVEERGTYQFQANSAAYHLAVFAQKPWLAGAVYFVLQDFASSPQYGGGNPLPDPPFNRKGLVDLTGAPKPAFAIVAAIYHATAQLGPYVRALARHAVSPASVPAGSVAVQISSAPVGGPVPHGFLGLSLEYGWVPAYTGFGATVNPVLVNLIRALAPGGRGLVLRIGGNSTDWTWWPVPGMVRPPGVSYALTPRWIAAVKRLAQATGARLILGINLEAGSSSVAVAEARALAAGLGRGRVEALEIGNEPEAYPLSWYGVANGQQVSGRAPGYDFDEYIREFAQLRALLRRAPLAGPATGSPAWLPNLPRLIATEPTLREVTFHSYPLSRCVTNPSSPQYPSVMNLLSPLSSVGLSNVVAPYTALVHRRGISFRVDELNSVTCHGQAGVSDTFASALWMVDTLFAMTRAGVDAVNIHTWTPAPANELFTFTQSGGRWVGSVRPAYYGALMFARAAPAGSSLLRTRVAGAGPVRVWAVRAPDGTVRLVAINASLTRAYRVRLLDGSGRTTAELERLTASSAYATGGVTLAGQGYGSQTLSGRLTGALRATALTRSRGGFAFALPAASAALLTLSG